MKPARYAAAAILTLAVGITGYAAFAHPDRAAPDAAYTLLDGSRRSIAEMKGKVVLVNFWATDCTVCLHEMPSLVATHEKFKARGYDTLAVSMRHDAPANVIRFAESRGLPFGVAIDNTGAIADAFGKVQATPTSVLIDRRGSVVARYVGEPDFEALHRLVEKLLADA